ncbi:DUF1178 family protein [Rhodobacteraceae bacterium NNCM2]|nr:DUF1178 family protein [Coraliihabitans acroporae]
MIRYELNCDRKHRFESWFASSAGFDEQVERGLVTCPQCGSDKVTKAIMAPAVAGKSEESAPLAQTSPAEAALRALRKKIEAESDYVGKDFVSEARKIHIGEAEDRAIWGEASHDDAKALKDEGIPVAPLPFMRRADG